MAKLPLTKINQLIKAESFLQVHFLKGYKYVDKAGELVNFFHSEDKKPPLFSMSMNSLVIKEPKGKAQEIKISPTDFWAHFVSPDSLEVMEDFFQPNADAITGILGIDEITRVGWRIYFVHEFETKEERGRTLEKFIPFKGLSLGEVYFTTTIGGVSSNVRLRSVLKDDEGEDSTPGLLIDVDFYKKYKEPSSSTELLGELKKFKEVVRSDDFLDFVNKILEYT